VITFSLSRHYAGVDEEISKGNFGINKNVGNTKWHSLQKGLKCIITIIK